MTQALPSLPNSFLERLSQIVPTAELDAVLNSFSSEKPTTFRVNPLKTDTQSLQQELTEQGFELKAVDWYDGAFILDNSQRRALTESPAFYAGRLYIQNLSSIVAPQVLAPQPDETVLDLAAAPGGKTLQLAAMMQNRGRLSAVEAVKGRFFKLRANLEQQGVEIARTYLQDGRAVGNKCPEMFDRVLLDAPCSSESRFTRRDPASWTHWSLRKVKETSKKQKRLLQSALYSLKPGGTLVYCTCSFAPEENELIVNAQLKKFGDALQIEPLCLPFTNIQAGLTQWNGKELHPDLAHSLRILPDTLMDGFYLCKLTKRRSLD